jgi:uncharacterized membrane protein
MAKVTIYEHNGWKQCWFYCPGCKREHAFTVVVPKTVKFVPWTWNNDIDKPTFRPSLLCNKNDIKRRCHSYVTAGQITFLADSFHELKNQTVELREV